MFERLGARLTRSVLLWDVLITLLSLQVATSIRLRLELGKYIEVQSAQLPWQLYVAVALIWSTVFLLLTPQRAVFTQGMLEAAGRLVAGWALASLTFAGLLFLTLRDVSRLQFVYFSAINLVLLLLVHLAVRAYIQLRYRRSETRQVLIVGGGSLAEQLSEEFKRRPWAGLEVVGYVGDAAPGDSALVRLGTLDDTVHIVDRQPIDEVIFTLPPQRHDDVARISLALSERPVMVHMVPGILDLTFVRATVETLGGVPLISLRESALSDSQRVLKRMFDIVASALLLLILGPLLLLIMLAIRLDSPGSIFFFQERIGEHGRRFKMIKFRSMYQDAERRWQEIARRSADGTLVHKQDHDPRVTRVGRNLRRTSLDELPQLYNVLLGQMSLVGPRPEMPYITTEYEPWQWQRFRVPPGMTGWWQVTGRGDKLMHLHTEDDLYYIQNYSFWLDIKILWRTIGTVLRRQGAY